MVKPEDVLSTPIPIAVAVSHTLALAATLVKMKAKNGLQQISGTSLSARTQSSETVARLAAAVPTVL